MAKTDFLTADMTRRQFMKISGKSLAGLTLSASMLSLFGCSQKQVDSGAVATWALPQGAFRDVYSVMNNWGANHGAISYGHIGQDLITLASPAKNL